MKEYNDNMKIFSDAVHFLSGSFQLYQQHANWLQAYAKIERELSDHDYRSLSNAIESINFKLKQVQRDLNEKCKQHLSDEDLKKVAELSEERDNLDGQLKVLLSEKKDLRALLTKKIKLVTDLRNYNKKIKELRKALRDLNNVIDDFSQEQEVDNTPIQDDAKRLMQDVEASLSMLYMLSDYSRMLLASCNRQGKDDVKSFQRSLFASSANHYLKQNDFFTLTALHPDLRLKIHADINKSLADDSDNGSPTTKRNVGDLLELVFTRERFTQLITMLESKEDAVSKKDAVSKNKPLLNFMLEIESYKKQLKSWVGEKLKKKKFPDPGRLLDQVHLSLFTIEGVPSTHFLQLIQLFYPGRLSDVDFSPQELEKCVRQLLTQLIMGICSSMHFPFGLIVIHKDLNSDNMVTVGEFIKDKINAMPSMLPNYYIDLQQKDINSKINARPSMLQNYYLDLRNKNIDTSTQLLDILLYSIKEAKKERLNVWVVLTDHQQALIESDDEDSLFDQHVCRVSTSSGMRQNDKKLDVPEFKIEKRPDLKSLEDYATSSSFLNITPCYRKHHIYRAYVLFNVLKSEKLCLHDKLSCVEQQLALYKSNFDPKNVCAAHATDYYFNRFKFALGDASGDRYYQRLKRPFKYTQKSGDGSYYRILKELKSGYDSLIQGEVRQFLSRRSGPS